MIQLNDFNIYYVILSVVVYTIFNWMWYAPVGNGEKGYLYDISKNKGNKIILIVLLFFLGLSVYLFFKKDNFKIHSLVLGYIIWMFIPFASTPINLPNLFRGGFAG
jgi:hypothetical protein